MGPPRLILASGSPRRRDLLAQIGVAFEVLPANIDETPRAGEAPEPYVRRLAEEAAAVAMQHPQAVVLAADTAVVLGAEILGKPTSPLDAARMLAMLSGKSHHVVTGVALAGAVSGVETTRTKVTFHTLTPEQIAWYIQTGEPLDKAGAYAIQGLGGAFVRVVEGSPTNVIGLPLGETLAMLAAAGIPLPWAHT